MKQSAIVKTLLGKFYKVVAMFGCLYDADEPSSAANFLDEQMMSVKLKCLEGFWATFIRLVFKP